MVLSPASALAHYGGQTDKWDKRSALSEPEGSPSALDLLRVKVQPRSMMSRGV